jgi:hypothetical protein
MSTLANITALELTDDVKLVLRQTFLNGQHAASYYIPIASEAARGTRGLPAL